MPSLKRQLLVFKQLFFLVKVFSLMFLQIWIFWLEMCIITFTERCGSELWKVGPIQWISVNVYFINWSRWKFELVFHVQTNELNCFSYSLFVLVLLQFNFIALNLSQSNIVFATNEKNIWGTKVNSQINRNKRNKMKQNLLWAEKWPQRKKIMTGK